MGAVQRRDHASGESVWSKRCEHAEGTVEFGRPAPSHGRPGCQLIDRTPITVHLVDAFQPPAVVDSTDRIGEFCPVPPTFSTNSWS